MIFLNVMFIRVKHVYTLMTWLAECLVISRRNISFP